MSDLRTTFGVTDPRGGIASRGSSFLAVVSRMRYIDRWALMRSSRAENLAEHSLDVAMIAHMLCVLGRVRHGRDLDADRAALIGLYHDASEIITGDMPTPVKYANGQIRDAYKDVEASAEQRLLDELPQDLAPAYRQILCPAASDAADGDEAYLRCLVKAADKLSALIKCLDETHAGNAEFRSAQATTQASVDAMAADHPEVADFVEQFLPPFGKTLDELL